jgi:hypothetical protein
VRGGFPNNPERIKKILDSATLYNPPDQAAILAIYTGSDGDATMALYAKLKLLGPAGVVAMNLFRAHKTSGRAKVYKGGMKGLGSYRAAAYQRKAYSLQELCKALPEHAGVLGIRWGWKEDPKQQNFSQVLYVDLPTGQVSFHSFERYEGPDYPGEWDGIQAVGRDRICNWCAHLFGGPLVVPPIPQDQMHKQQPLI